MKYAMKGGALYRGEALTARIRGTASGPEKSIFSPDGQLLLRTTLRISDSSGEDARLRQYVLLDADGREAALGTPDYIKDGQSADRGLPAADRAWVAIGEEKYRLTMKNSQNYLLESQAGEAVVQVLHRGLAGGWDIDADDELGPGILCGIFVFCRYLEQENGLLDI